MIIYVVLELDADQYCGNHLVGCFSTEQLAQSFINKNSKKFEQWFISEQILDNPEVDL